MSRYTTELRSICSFYSGLPSTPYAPCILKAAPKIFDFTFPIFDEKYRIVLETKILKHFYMREIGLETFGAWKLCLDDTLNNIMPYYNKKYKAFYRDFDFLVTESISERSAGRGSANSTGKNIGDSVDTVSDTPQGTIQNLRDGKYLTSATLSDTNNETTANTSTENTTENFITGYRGYAPAELLEKFYNSLINVDKELLDELEPLFMQIW